MSGKTDIQSGLRRHVNKIIFPIQGAYLGTGAAHAAALTKLAAMRRLSSSSRPSLLSMGDLVLAGWPEDELGEPRSNSKSLKAACGALGLYALAQQSKDYGVAGTVATGSSHQACPFGKACWLIQPDSEKSSGVKNRLALIESAIDFDGVMVAMRGLIALMRSARDSEGKPRIITLDYGMLASDLYEIQNGGDYRRAVLDRWGTEYFYIPKRNNEDLAASPADKATD